MPTIPELRHAIDKYGVGVRALWRQGWTEMPFVLASMPILFASFVVGFIASYRYDKHEFGNRQYRYCYTVYRPDDSRAENVRRFLVKTRRASYAESLSRGPGFFSQ